MPRKPQPPADFELQILGVLWEHGPQTVRGVMERLTDGRERAYTSVLSVMQVMKKKGLLRTSRKKEGLAHIFEPKVDRNDVVQPMFQGLVDRVFGGRAADAVQHLLSGSEVQSEDFNELRKLLDEMESKQK